MRTRQEIEERLLKNIQESTSLEGIMIQNLNVQTELLLDIRELLATEKKPRQRVLVEGNVLTPQEEERLNSLDL